MTIEQILTGPTEDRTNDQARRREPLTEAQARLILCQMERQMPKSRRGKAVRFFTISPVSNLTDAARALYDAYATAYGA